MHLHDEDAANDYINYSQQKIVELLTTSVGLLVAALVSTGRPSRLNAAGATLDSLFLKLSASLLTTARRQRSFTVYLTPLSSPRLVHDLIALQLCLAVRRLLRLSISIDQ